MDFVPGRRRMGKYNYKHEAVYDGARCTICRTVVTKSIWKTDETCSKCLARSVERKNMEASLLKIHKKHLGRELALPKHQASVRKTQHHPAERRHLECSIVKETCTVSLVAMAFDMQKMQRESNVQYPGYIKKIEEFRFYTDEHWNFDHYVFVIYTADCTVVFDPTGIQFGPDWALVKDYKQYKRDHVRQILSEAKFGTRFFAYTGGFTAIRDLKKAPSELIHRQVPQPRPATLRPPPQLPSVVQSPESWPTLGSAPHAKNSTPTRRAHEESKMSDKKGKCSEKVPTILCIKGTEPKP